MNIIHNNYPHVREYVSSWKKVVQMAKTNPDSIIKIYWNMEKTATETRKWFMSAVHNRINRRAQDYQRGKNDGQDFYRRARRDQEAIKNYLTHRIIIRQFETKECRNRFSHLLFKEE